MAGEIGFGLDEKALLAATAGLETVLERYTRPACLVTAHAVEKEAQARLGRQLGPLATGQTRDEITVETMRDGNGYAVVSQRDPFPNLPLWIEKGTRKGKPGSHTEPARPYFDVSAKLEQGAHRRRIIEAITAGLKASGLGG